MKQLPYNIKIPDDMRQDIIKIIAGSLWRSMLKWDKKIRIQEWLTKLYKQDHETK